MAGTKGRKSLGGFGIVRRNFLRMESGVSGGLGHKLEKLNRMVCLGV
jgi:hypothetical protein